jgi:hypothetical protein
MKVFDKIGIEIKLNGTKSCFVQKVISRRNVCQQIVLTVVTFMTRSFN